MHIIWHRESLIECVLFVNRSTVQNDAFPDKTEIDYIITLLIIGHRKRYEVVQVTLLIIGHRLCKIDIKLFKWQSKLSAWLWKLV